MLSLRIPVKVSFNWASDPAARAWPNLMVAVWLSLLKEISGLESTTEPLAETTALWISISLELRVTKSVSSFTSRLDVDVSDLYNYAPRYE